VTWLAALALVGCGDGEKPSPTVEAERTPMPAKRLPVHESAAYLREVLYDCLSREALNPSKLDGTAPILDEARAQSAGGVAINVPEPLSILYVVYSPAQAKVVVRQTKHHDLIARGRVVYDREKFAREDIRARVHACVDEAERAAPVAQSG
jgi:hypothetical protein